MIRHSAAQSPDELQQFRWRLPKQFEGMARSDLPPEVRVESEDARGAVVVLVGAAALVYIARSILRLHDELRGGTVIDVRSNELSIERDGNLPGGTLVIVSKTGATFYERKDIGGPSDLVSAIQSKK
jgi:hypothetical protein